MKILIMILVMLFLNHMMPYYRVWINIPYYENLKFLLIGIFPIHSVKSIIRKPRLIHPQVLSPVFHVM